MLTLKANLINIFMGSDYIDKQTGEVTKGKPKLQLLAKIPLKNGEYKSQLIDLSIPIEKLALYKDKVTEIVEVEVGLIGDAKFYGI
ncbi:MAG: hypothetical protein PHN18_03005 [Sulfurospirillaceae bacterium]|nr:hypothetical protein [Sulfurospirillaceae bacterium]MDD2825624.1 hypothetical protein [Sulfurospirillaceae bacterium]